MDLALMIEGQDGLNWERWKRIAQATEDLGFAGLYRSDHYTNSQPPEKDSLELWVSLTYLATNTRRIDFGPLVTPFSPSGIPASPRAWQLLWTTYLVVVCSLVLVRVGTSASTTCLVLICWM
jgi:hypothetical protein